MTLRTGWVALLAGFGMLASGCTTEETPVTAEVRITPASHSLAPGGTVALQAAAFDRDGNPRGVLGATWSSRIPTIATVGATSGMVTALAPGIVEISATLEGVTGSALITVEYPEPRVRSVRIEPGSAALRTGDTRALTAIALDAQGAPIPGRTASWQTTAPTVATISGSGLVTAVGQGQAVIFARVDDQTGAIIVEVSPRAASVQLSGRSLLDQVADTSQLSAVVRDVDGNVVPSWPVNWSSSDPSVAKVETSGKVSSQGLGSTSITATSEGVVAVLQVTVSRLPVAEVTIPVIGTLGKNRTSQLVAIATSAGGQLLRGRSATWESSNPAVATISASGLLSSLAVGTTMIAAVVEGTRAERSLQVVEVSSPSLSLGVWHTCSLAGNGQVQCWGERPAAGTGQDACIDVTYYNTPFQCTRTPTPVTGGAQLVTVTAGGWHSCGLTAAGAAWCWGNNWSNELGGPNAGPSEAPVQVSGGHSFVSLALGTGFSCGLKQNGEAYCWGANSTGQLGIGSLQQQSSPTLVAGGHYFVQLTAGESHACGLTQLSRIHCWGYNQFGQLGDGTLNSRSTPTDVITLQSFVEVEAGSYHTCALTLAGAAWCWGNGLDGQIGDGVGVNRQTPVAVTGGHQWSRISAGSWSTCGTRTDGAGFCWGANWYGGLGVGGFAGRATPTAVAGSLSFVEIVAGGMHSCGRTVTGAVYCWGLGMTGALGLGAEVVDQYVPKKTLGNP